MRGSGGDYGVPMNGWALGAFRMAVGQLWWRTLRRRSQGCFSLQSSLHSGRPA